MKSALIWYNTFVNTLKKMDFELNPFDPCIANKVIDGHQCTIVWYVDNTKISHKDPQVVTNIIKAIEVDHDQMTLKRGKSHTFVGMNFELKDDGSLHIWTKEYIREALADLRESVENMSPTPASKSLFNINDKSLELPEWKANIFHIVVAKLLLYVSCRSCLDIGLTVAFLTTRVSKATFQDWEKLKRLLRYLKGTFDMPRIIKKRIYR